MTVLKPRLTLPLTASVSFLVLLLIYAIAPQRDGALVALALLLTLIVSPLPPGRS